MTPPLPSALCETLQHLVDHDSLAQCYLFVGPAISFRQYVLQWFANTIHRTESETNPDAIQLTDPTSIKIETIRTTLDRIKYGPSQSRYLTVSIPEAHTLTAQAANALLKPIEAPPENVIFLLGAPSPSRVLPTILSRAQVIKCPAASSSELMKWMSDQGISSAWKSAPNTLISRTMHGEVPDSIPSIHDLITWSLGSRIIQLAPLAKSKDGVHLAACKWLEELTSTVSGSTHMAPSADTIRRLDLLVENILHLRYNANPRLFLDRIAISL